MKIFFETAEERSAYRDQVPRAEEVLFITQHAGYDSGSDWEYESPRQVAELYTRASTPDEAAKNLADRVGWRWMNLKGFDLLGDLSTPSLCCSYVTVRRTSMGVFGKKPVWEVCAVMYQDVDLDYIALSVGPCLAEMLLNEIGHYRETRLQEITKALIETRTDEPTFKYLQLNRSQAKMLYKVLSTTLNQSMRLTDFCARLKGGIDLESEITKRYSARGF